MIIYNDDYNNQLLQLCIKFGTRTLYSRLKPTKRRISKYNYLYEYVMQCTKNFLDNTYSFNMRLYWVLNKFQDFPKCKVCHKPIVFKNHKCFRLKLSNKNQIIDVWPKHCSTKCAQNNISTREKYKQTSIKKYGTNFPWQSKLVIEKIENTIEQKYGKRHYAQTDAWKNKVIKTNLKNIGVEFHMQLKKYQNKAKKTYYNKTGYFHPLQNPNIQTKIIKKYKYNSTTFDSSIELAYYIWLSVNNIDFVFQPKDKIIPYYDKYGKKHIYHPDFYLTSTDILIELKGDNHFNKHGVLKDISNPRKNYIAEAKYQCMIQHNVKIIKQSELKMTAIKYCVDKFKSKTWYKKFEL